MRRLLLAQGLIAGALFLAPTAHAENWPRFRGPEGQGHAQGSFVDAVKQQQFAWRQKIEGTGHSSPIVWEDHVYLTAADNDGKRSVLCLSATDGHQIWKNESKFVEYRKHKDNSFASPTPAADELGIYVVFTSPQEYSLLAFDHNGKQRWKQSLGRFDSTHGGGSSPTVYKNFVIVNDDQESPGSALLAFDTKTGKQVWKSERKSTKKAAMSTPAIWKPDGGHEQIVITTWGGGIQGYDPEKGKLIWSLPDAFFSRSIGSPQFNGKVIVGVCGEPGKRGLVAIEPDPTGKTAPKKLYEMTQTGPHVPSPLILNDHLLLLNDVGQVTCCDLMTGKPLWSEKLGEDFYGSPILTGTTLWAIGRKGTMFGIDVADGYKPLCKVPLGSGTQCTPAVANGRMFIRTASEVLCISGKALD